MTKVFISHSAEDRELAEQLALKLKQYKIEPFLDELRIGQGLSFEKIFDDLGASDFWVVLFSKFTPSAQDFDTKAKKQLHNRNISVIPVLVSGQSIPFEFRDRTIINIKKDPERELDKVARYLRNVPNVDFNALDHRAFEELVTALLKRLSFKEIQVADGGLDYGYDIQAKTTYRDPFGSKHDVKWLIELKFYKESRADIQALSQLSHYLNDLPPNHNGVLITNSQLTSAAREWLQENERSRRTSITVVDGVKLRELILKYDELVERFFESRG